MYVKYVLPVFVLFLSACDLSPTLDDRVTSYIDSLNRYEKLSINPIAYRFPEFTLPAIKFRTQNLTVFDISLIEFLSLQHCDIGYLAGEKNSLLGKVMSHSQRLIYEINIIRAIEGCEIHSEGLNERLVTVSQIKRVELQKAFSNAIWSGGEIERFFSVSNGYLPMTIQTLDLQALEYAFAELNKIATKLQSLPYLDADDVEDNFKVIYHSEYGGQLILTLLLLTDLFNSIHSRLDALDINIDFCKGPIIFLKQQFTIHYIEQLQPYMAKINSTAYRLLTLIDELHQKSGEMATEMHIFLNQLSLNAQTGIWKEYQAASRLHAKAWGRLLRGCDVF